MRSSVPADATPIVTSSTATNAEGSQTLRPSCISAPPKKNGRTRGPADLRMVSRCSVAARSEQLHQHHEQVDEVEIQAQRPHDRLLAASLVIVALVIHFLDLL